MNTAEFKLLQEIRDILLRIEKSEAGNRKIIEQIAYPLKTVKTRKETNLPDYSKIR